MTRQETDLLMRSISDLRSDVNRRMDEAEERTDEQFAKINARLDAGDKRFAESDQRAAEIRGMSRVAMWIGSGVLLSAGMAGKWAVDHTDKILTFLTGR